MGRMFRILVISAALLTLWSAPVAAVATIGTGFGGPGGTVTISASNVTGSGIFIDSIV